MVFKEFKDHIVELQRNPSMKKDYGKRTSGFPSHKSYITHYKNFRDPLIFDTVKNISIEVRYYVQGADYYIVPWTKIGNVTQSIGMLHLQKTPEYNGYGYNIFEITNSYLKPEYIGQRIMPTIYSGLIERGFNLAAVDTQSEGARKMWKNLYGIDGIKIWAVIGLRFFTSKNFKRSKKDWIESINLSDKLLTLPSNPNELAAVVMTPDGVESIQSVYTDTEGYEEYESVMIMTKDGSDLDQDLDSMKNYDEFDNERNLYTALQQMLLQIKK